MVRYHEVWHSVLLNSQGCLPYNYLCHWNQHSRAESMMPESSFILQVMRMTYRHLTPEEERLEESVMAFWNQFLVLLQEAMEFVNLQTPLIIQSLDSLFKVHPSILVVFA